MANDNLFSGLIFFVMTLTVPAYAVDRSVWELGIGASVISFSDYVGSDKRNNLVLPVPFVNYYGDIVRIDRDSVRSEFFDSDTLKIDVSLSGSIPVDSDDNKDREGMPDLDPIIELGPSLEYEFYRHPLNNSRLSVELPIRSAIASDFSDVKEVGWISNPNVKYSRKEYDMTGTWTLQAALGPLFGNSRYHQYFYGVRDKFANTQRPPFDADSGFGGWRLSLGFSRRVNDIWYGGFVRYIDISNADFADSPLVKQDHSLIGGLAIAWIFAKSASLRE